MENEPQNIKELLVRILDTFEYIPDELEADIIRAINSEGEDA